MIRGRNYSQLFKLTAVSLLVFFMTSCAYLEDRRQDLTDMAHVDYTELAIGVSVNAGPVIVGAFEVGHIMNSAGKRVKLGLGGVQNEKQRGETVGVVFPISRSQIDTYEDDFYKGESPALGSIGFDLGFIFGIGARVDAVEAVDFVLGIFGIDILGDDKASEEMRSKEEE